MKSVAAIAAAAGLTAPAAQAAILFSDPGGPYTEMLHNDAAPTGTKVTLESQSHGDLVELFSTSTLDPAGNGNGFAQVGGPFTQITIDPLDPLLGFSKIGFTLNPTASLGSGAGKLTLFDYSFSVDLSFIGGGVQTLTSAAFPSFQKFDIWQQLSDPGAISSVKIYNLVAFAMDPVVTTTCTTDKKGKTKCRDETSSVLTQHAGLAFEDIRQISYDGIYPAPPPPPPVLPPPTLPMPPQDTPSFTPSTAVAVPEPATWAMLIAGFIAVGAAIRRRRRVAA